MALLNEVDLKLNITAQDKASAILKDLMAVVDDLKTTLAEMSAINPFVGIKDGAMQAVTAIGDLKTALDGISNMSFESIFTPLTEQAKVAAEDSSYAFFSAFADLKLPTSSLMGFLTESRTISGQIIEEFDSGFKTIQDPLLSWVGTATEIVDSLGTVKTYITEIESSASKNPYQNWRMPPGITSAASESTVAAEVAAGKSGNLLKSLGEIPGSLTSSLMNTGMNGMMGYFAMTSLATNAQNLGYIQQMMQLGQGKTGGSYSGADVNSAAQAYAMLGSAGLTGSSGVSFLTGLKSNLTSMFTRVGGGGLSKNALMLEQYGLGPQDSAASPWATLQHIQQIYTHLMGQGRANAASQLVSLTGTSQLTGLFQHWSQMASQMSGLNMGMNGAQLNKAVGGDIGLQGNLQKLSIAFAMFSASIVPILNGIVKAFTDLLSGVQGKNGSSPFTNFSNTIVKITQDLGPLGTAIAALVVTLKGIGIAKAVGAGLSGGAGSGIAFTAGAVASKIPSALTALKGLGAGAMSMAKLAGMTAIGNVMSMLSGVAETLTGAFAALNAPLIAIVAAIAVVIGAIVLLITHWKAVSQWLNNVASDLEKWASGLWKKIAPGVDAVVKNINAWANGLWNGVQSAFTSFTSSLATWARGLWNAVSQFFQSLLHPFGAPTANTPSAVNNANIVKGQNMMSYDYSLLQQSTPLLRGTGGVVHHSGNSLTVTVTGATGQAKQDAQHIATAIVSQLKLKGNFDWSF